MKRDTICITGASGLVGSRIARRLHEIGSRVIVVGRSPDRLPKRFTFAEACLGWEDLATHPMAEVSAIINLAGASVMAERWTPAYKAKMMSSRIDATRSCVEICKSAPHVDLLNASAISAYGFYVEDGHAFGENDVGRRFGRETFLQELIDAWEQATEPAKDAGARVLLLRLGVVFTPDDAVLKLFSRLFRLFVGGPVGTGRQVMSWISVEDLVSALIFLLERRDIAGPVNLVSPGACRNAAFALAMGSALGRPSLVRTPSFVIKALMGQMGDELVLHGQRVAPGKLLEAGFAFDHADIADYLKDVYR
ncbi:MAG: TIGR01777 family oxidoreductase [Pseudomonadota bacterium]